MSQGESFINYLQRIYNLVDTDTQRTQPPVDVTAVLVPQTTRAQPRANATQTSQEIPIMNMPPQIAYPVDREDRLQRITQENMRYLVPRRYRNRNIGYLVPNPTLYQGEDAMSVSPIESDRTQSDFSTSSSSSSSSIDSNVPIRRPNRRNTTRR